jgi:hypothetical protein
LPYDVRQSGFVGSGINAVKSGSNEIEGSVYTSTRSNKKFIGTKAGDRTIVPGNFTENITGFRIGAQ